MLFQYHPHLETLVCFHPLIFLYVTQIIDTNHVVGVHYQILYIGHGKNLFEVSNYSGSIYLC